jgi:hypothetical protein
MDVWYVDNWSLTLDLKILATTFLAVLRREGINAEGSVTMPKFSGSASSRENHSRSGSADERQ